MQSLAEWKFGSGNVGDKKKKKQRVNLEPPRPMAARLKIQTRNNMEIPLMLPFAKKPVYTEKNCDQITGEINIVVIRQSLTYHFH